jgi:hypothetical protein
MSDIVAKIQPSGPRKNASIAVGDIECGDLSPLF